MESADLAAMILVLAALIGCINYLWIRLPPTIGVLVGSLVLSLLIVSSDRVFHLHVMSWFRRTLDAANFPNLFLDGALALLLFAGSLHIDLAELRRRRWMILLLATASVILSTLVFGFGIWATFILLGATVPLAWCFVLARGVAVLTWAGLRGGISVALALTLPASSWRGDLLLACYAVVVFTIVVQGLTMPAFLRAVYGEMRPE